MSFFERGGKSSAAQVEKTPFDTMKEKLDGGEPLSLYEAVLYAYTVSNTNENGRYQKLWEPGDDDESLYAFPVHDRLGEIVHVDLQSDVAIETKLGELVARRDYPNELKRPLKKHLVDILNNRFQAMQKLGTTSFHTKHEKALKETISETLGETPVEAKKMMPF